MEEPDPGACRGSLDRVARDCVEGWVQDEGQPGEAVTVRIYDNGLPLGVAVADRYREDLKQAGVGDGRHAFVFTVPSGLDPGVRHLIDVRRADDGRRLDGAPVIREVQASTLAHPSRAASAPPWRGDLDLATRARLEGWAWDPSAPNEPVALVVLDNGAVIARILANRFRRDLADAGFGDGRHSFSIQIPGGLSPLVRHVIQIVGETDGCEMPGSPVVIEAATAFDPALQATLEAAIGALEGPGESDRALEVLAALSERVLEQRAARGAGLEARLIQQRFARRTVVGSTPLQPDAEPRALVIAERMPEGGAGAPLMSHLRGLVAAGFTVSFVAAEEMSPDPEALAAIGALGVAGCCAPYYVSVEEVLRRQRGGFDVVYLDGPVIAARYLALTRLNCAHARIVVSVRELGHLRLARQAKVEGRPDILGRSKRLRAAELSAAEAADVVMTPSAVEAALLRQALPRIEVQVVPWAVPLRSSATPWCDRSDLGFIGDLSHPSALDALSFLVTEIMPHVWREDPGVRCRIAAPQTPTGIKALAGPRVVFEGLGGSGLLDEVKATVAPFRHGAGVKAAVLESFAAGVPCVMSRVAFEGIGLRRDLALIAEEPEDAARLILQACQGQASAAESQSQALKAFIQERYSDQAVEDAFRATLRRRRAEHDPPLSVLGSAPKDDCHA